MQLSINFETLIFVRIDVTKVKGRGVNSECN